MLPVVVSLVLAAGVLLLVDARQVARLIAQSDPVLLLAALLLVQAQILASAWRWRFTAGRLGLQLPYRTAVAEYYVASLLNLVLPGGVAGDVARAVRHARGDETAGAGSAALAVVLERAAGQSAFAILALGGMIAWIVGGGADLPGWAVPAIGLVPALLAAAAVVLGAGGRWGGRRAKALAGAVGPAVRRVFGGWRVFTVQAVVSLGIAASFIALFALCGAAIGAPVPPAGITTLIPLALLAMLVPVSVGGWGLREGAAALLWPLVGLTAAEGTATAALYGLVSLAGALPGTLVPLMSRRA